MALTSSAALWFLPFALPISIWVAWNDMKFMKIPNMAVLALALVFLVIGLIALPFEDYATRWLHLLAVLVIGFALNMIGSIGAGDAKFAAAMAPFVALGDLRLILFLLATVIVAAVMTHRLFRRIRRLSRPNAGLGILVEVRFSDGAGLGRNADVLSVGRGRIRHLISLIENI